MFEVNSFAHNDCDASFLFCVLASLTTELFIFWAFREEYHELQMVSYVVRLLNSPTLCGDTFALHSAVGFYPSTFIIRPFSMIPCTITMGDSMQSDGRRKDGIG